MARHATAATASPRPRARLRRILEAGGIAMVVLTACTAGPVATVSPAATASALPTATASPIPSPTPAPNFDVDHQRLETTYDGDARIVELYLPKLPQGVTAPLIILLHAFHSSPSAMIQLTRFDLIAERDGAIVVAPPAAGLGWDADVCCSALPEPNADTRYLSALIADLTGTLPVDPHRVFVAGYSIGAEMTDRMACEFSDRIAAVAIDAGTSFSDTCQPDKPVSVLIMHGTADSTFSYTLAQSLAGRWRRVDECTGDPATSSLGSTATAETSDRCKGATAVEFVTIAGGTHMWFEDPDATELAWQFFSTHPRP